MRFTVQKKVIVLGFGLSTFFVILAFLVSFFIFRSNSRSNFIKSVDNSITELESTIGDQESIEGMYKTISNTFESYLSHMHDEVPEFKTYKEKYDYYANIYPNIYSKPGIIGLSQLKLQLQNYYLEISSNLANAAISAGGGVAYAGIILPEELTGDYGRLMYLYDSEFRFTNTYEEYDDMLDRHFFGSDYKFQIDDLDENPENSSGGYIINEKKARTIDICFNLTIEDLQIDLTQYGVSAEDAEILKKYTLDVTAFIEYDETQLEKSIATFALIDGLSLFVGAILLAVIYILVARYTIVKNLVKLTKSTNEFTDTIKNDSISKVIDPDIKSNDEIGDLSNSFTKMEEEIINYTNKIKTVTKEQERMNAELNIASKIQLEALPKSFLNDKNVLIKASIASAKEVGGDFYDYFYIDDNHLAIIISDVSGKGIPASLFMMRSKQLIKSKLLIGGKLEDICHEVNNELIDNNEAGLFLTSFIGILDIKTGNLDYVLAGHEKPYIISEDKVYKLDGNSNFILGGVKDFIFKTNKIKLKPNTKLFLYTDGLNESINREKEEFGYDRILKNLEKDKNNSIEKILSNMSAALLDFTKTNEAFDDVTMLIVELKSEKLTFKFEKPNYEVIDVVNNGFNDYYSYLDKKILSEVNIIFDELLNNYISYEEKEDLIIRLDAEIKDNLLIINLSNNGVEYNPLNYKEKYFEEYDSKLTLGGFGISLVNKLSDELKYERKNDINYLTIKKKIK